MFSRPTSEGNGETPRHPHNLVTGTHSHGPRRPAIIALRQQGGVIGVTFARIGALPSDSRERLTTKEQQLAELGISWATDTAYDAELARDLARSRLRRHKGVPTATSAPAEVPRTMVGRRFRWSVGVLLIHAGQRLQGGEPVRTAV